MYVSFDGVSFSDKPIFRGYLWTLTGTLCHNFREKLFLLFTFLVCNEEITSALYDKCYYCCLLTKYLYIFVIHHFKHDLNCFQLAITTCIIFLVDFFFKSQPYTSFFFIMNIWDTSHSVCCDKQQCH